MGLIAQLLISELELKSTAFWLKPNVSISCYFISLNQENMFDFDNNTMFPVSY